MKTKYSNIYELNIYESIGYICFKCYTLCIHDIYHIV